MIVGAEMKEITSYLKTIPMFAQVKNSKLNLNFFRIIIVFFILWGGGLLVGRLIALPKSIIIYFVEYNNLNQQG